MPSARDGEVRSRAGDASKLGGKAGLGYAKLSPFHPRMRALLRYAGMADVEQQLLMMTDDDGDSCLKYAAQASDEAPGESVRAGRVVACAGCFVYCESNSTWNMLSSFSRTSSIVLRSIVLQKGVLNTRSAPFS